MSRKAVFSSWDRFQLPLPFGRILLVYGKPMVFGVETPDEGVAETIRDALLRVTAQAEEILGTRSP